MGTIKNNLDRAVFVDVICDWFRQNNNFWAVISLISFSSIIALQIFFTFTTGINPKVRLGIDFLIIPILGLFVFSIFWRSAISTFLSLSGALSTYVGMYYIYARFEGLKILPPVMLNKLGGEGQLVAGPPIEVANFYFMGGMFFLAICLAISLRPSFFKAKGSENSLVIPIWDYKNSEIAYRAKSVQLIPVTGLLSFAEIHLSANYKYILAEIFGNTYYVNTADWVPQGTLIIRDKNSGALCGIPKIPDGFNIS